VAQRDIVNSAPRVSVLIANYNGMGLIKDCIDSIRAQDCGFAVEIIVHDDASTDGSVQYIREHYPDVTLIESATNAGFCVANNRMAARASGEFLLLLNNDAALFPDALRTLDAETARLKAPAILSLPQYDWESRALVDRGLFLDPFFNPVPNLNEGQNEVAYVIGACLWIPKHLWEELGGFPEWFQSLAEDMYLCCRARLAGYGVQVPKASGYRHRQGASFSARMAGENASLVTSIRRRALSERNKTFTMIVTEPAPLLWIMLPLHFMALALEGAALSLVKGDRRIWCTIYAPCLASVWKESARLAKLRAAVQQGRKINLSAWLSCFILVPQKLRLLMRHGVPEIRQ
jgi:GT2 family glycosyltransferase